MFTWTKSMMLVGTFMVAASFCPAQDKTEQKPVVKPAVIQQTSPASGKKMFVQYCAPCHGTDGGTGPVAGPMKVPPTDLTQLAKKQGGKYPATHVSSVMKFGSGTASEAHGSADMPVWGPLFKSLDKFHNTTMQQRVGNLVDHIGTLQAK